MAYRRRQLSSFPRLSPSCPCRAQPWECGENLPTTKTEHYRAWTWRGPQMHPSVLIPSLHNCEASRVQLRKQHHKHKPWKGWQLCSMLLSRREKRSSNVCAINGTHATWIFFLRSHGIEIRIRAWTSTATRKIHPGSVWRHSIIQFRVAHNFSNDSMQVEI